MRAKGTSSVAATANGKQTDQAAATATADSETDEQTLESDAESELMEQQQHQQQSTKPERGEQLARCLAIVAKNVPLTDELLGQLAECQLVTAGDRSLARSAKGQASLRHHQSDGHQLFAAMATMDRDSIKLLAACLRTCGHPLMSELLLQAVSDSSSASDAGGQPLPESILAQLGGDSVAESDLRQLLAERQLLTWSHRLFDPAGADVMSLRRQHAEESWRAAKEARETATLVAELRAQLSSAQAALAERDNTVARLESRLSELAASAGGADAATQLEVSRRHQAASESQTRRAFGRLESFAGAFDFVRQEMRHFEADAAAAGLQSATPEDLPEDARVSPSGEGETFVESLKQELADDARRLEAFKADFGARFLGHCRVLLDERRQLMRLAESLRVGSGETEAKGKFDPSQPLPRELARLVAGVANENATLTARHRMLSDALDGVDDGESEADAEDSDNLVAAVGCLRRQLADRDRRIAALTDRDTEDDNNDDGSRAAAASPLPTPRRRSEAVNRAWDELLVAPAPTTTDSSGDTEPLRRYSVLPDIQQRSAQQQQPQRRQSGSVAVGIPHSHRKATKREANVKKREPPGKPLPANVVSLS